MKENPSERRGEWVWTAGGAAIVDGAGDVKQILILGTNVLMEDDAIARTNAVLNRVQRRMELFQPSDVANDGAELMARVDDAIIRWREKIRTS